MQTTVCLHSPPLHPIYDMTASENPILAEIQTIRSKGVQPKHNDVYDEIKPELFTEALNGQVAIVTGSGRVCNPSRGDTAVTGTN